MPPKALQEGLEVYPSEVYVVPLRRLKKGWLYRAPFWLEAGPFGGPREKSKMAKKIYGI